MTGFSEKSAEKAYNKGRQQFRENDLPRVLNNRERIKSKFLKNKKLAAYLEEFRLIMSMLSDYYHRRYKAVPWYVISSIGATMLYVLTPIDMITDFIPVVGLIDDAAVFGVCLNLVRNEVEKYKIWKAGSGNEEGIDRDNLQKP